MSSTDYHQNGAGTAAPGDREAADILVVDDSPSNLLAVEAALGDLGRRVIKASSGPEALKRLLEQDFALILLDVQMPTMDGFQTARIIRERERNRRTPIIFVTAHSSTDADVLQAYELGAVDFLFKPIVPTVLRAKASVFVDLQLRTAEVAEQAELLRQAERRAHEQVLEDERRRWEQEVLRRQMEAERRRAEDLARTVAEKERIERQLVRINEQLAETDRRKDEFLAVLAHELRNPLAPIVASLELLRTRLPDSIDDPVVLRARDAMERQVKHLRRLVDDLLDVSRISSGKITLNTQQLDLRDVIQQAVNISEPVLTERRHHLVVSVPDLPVELQADAVRLAQVVANLLNNAARYTEPGGNVQLSCDLDDEEAIVSISDDGQGIAPELIDRIFDMFVQQREGGGGLGIGLTLVKRLVEMHGGSVTAQSPGAGRGSRFVVTLPLTLGSGDQEAYRKSFASLADLGPLRVVLVEDNPDIRATTRDLIESWGHSVLVAEDGRKGVELIVRERPDVAVVDIGLPELDGCQVAEQVRRVLPDLPLRLVAMTGFGQDKDRQRALSSGFDYHLVKPASADTLRAALVGVPLAGAAVPHVRSDGAPQSRPPAAR